MTKNQSFSDTKAIRSVVAISCTRAGSVTCEKILTENKLKKTLERRVSRAGTEGLAAPVNGRSAARPATKEANE